MENTMIESWKEKLIRSARWTNDNAKSQDTNRNHVNYGATTVYADILRDFGVSTDVSVYEENGFLMIPKILIGTKIINFHICEGMDLE
jgi:hypothetical protein